MITRTAACVGVMGLLVAAAVGGCQSTPVPPAARMDAVGPAFTLPVAGGDDTLALADVLARNKLTVVMFIATQCPVSNAYNARMAALARAFKPRGVGFVGVNSNRQEAAEEVSAHAERHSFAFPVVKDAGNKVADLYGARVTPEVFVLDGTGRIRYHGRIDENQGAASDEEVRSPDLRRALEALLDGRSPPTTDTKAFGCSIKRI